jgi:hypothetical protein
MLQLNSPSNTTCESWQSCLTDVVIVGGAIVITIATGGVDLLGAAGVAGAVVAENPEVVEPAAEDSALAEASGTTFEAADNVDEFTVSAKHLANAGGRWSRFSTNSQTQIRDWIQEALTSPNARFYPNGDNANSFQVITDMGYTIGTKGQTSIKIIVGRDGGIWTAYPTK